MYQSRVDTEHISKMFNDNTLNLFSTKISNLEIHYQLVVKAILNFFLWLCFGTVSTSLRFEKNHGLFSSKKRRLWIQRDGTGTKKNPWRYEQSRMKDNTENKSPWTDAKINCLLALWMEGGSWRRKAGISYASTLESHQSMYTDVTTATMQIRQIIFRHHW